MQTGEGCSFNKIHVSPHGRWVVTVLTRFVQVFWGRVLILVGVADEVSRLCNECRHTIGSHRWPCDYAGGLGREMVSASSFVPEEFLQGTLISN